MDKYMNKETFKAGWKYGLAWGLFMFTFSVIIPMIKEKELDPTRLLIGLIMWMFGGFCFGLWMNHSLQKRKIKRQNQKLEPTVKTPVE
jgi:hypothetical protein